MNCIFIEGNSVSYVARTSFKIMVGIWLLCMIVLVNAYSGGLTSLLTVPKLEPIANTLKDVAESNTLRLTVERASIFAINFLVFKTKMAKLIFVRLFTAHFFI